MELERIMMNTNLLIWYLEHDLEVTAVYTLIQWQPVKPFENWVLKIAQGRRDATMQKDLVKDMINKTQANSAYGMSLFNAAK